jgi:hypothetical protein
MLPALTSNVDAPIGATATAQDTGVLCTPAVTRDLSLMPATTSSVVFKRATVLPLRVRGTAPQLPATRFQSTSLGVVKLS